MPEGGRKKGNVEIYDKGRYFTVSGNRLDETPQDIRPAQEAINELLASRFKKETPPQATRPCSLPGPSLDDSELIQKAIESQNGHKFDLLYQGRWQEVGCYPSQSEADQGFCDLLAFWTGRDAARIDSIFRQSGLMRPKWDEKHYGDGRTYGQVTIEKAISNCQETYSGKPPDDDYQFDGCSDTDESVEGNTETGSGLSDNGKQQHKKVTIEDVVLPIGAFYQLDVSERQEFLFPWLKEDSINLVSGWRGCGKTWLALGILDAVTRGASFGPWECKKPVPCLFVDGEMTVTDDHERIKSLRLNSGRESPFYFYSDAYANQLGLPRAHIANESWRTKIKSILLSRHIKLWVLDNLASLASGLDENKKRDWDPINQWLLELRFAGISTIMLHHTSKEGQQRGTSAREDNLDTSIMLKAPYDYTPEDGARFVVHFSKARVQTSRLNLLSDTEFKLTLDEAGNHTWTYSNVKRETRSEVLRLLDEGMTQTDIKNTLGIHKGTVSKIRTRAIKDGLLTPKNKLTQAGIMAVNG
ncbi:MAG: AAA family ATPase [Deltaproteobacteria bacterium]|nr:AAA family ATPase [Deltaproteobacteria bacterium]